MGVCSIFGHPETTKAKIIRNAFFLPLFLNNFCKMNSRLTAFSSQKFFDLTTSSFHLLPRQIFWNIKFWNRYSFQGGSLFLWKKRYLHQNKTLASLSSVVLTIQSTLWKLSAFIRWGLSISLITLIHQRYDASDSDHRKPRDIFCS